MQKLILAILISLFCSPVWASVDFDGTDDFLNCSGAAIGSDLTFSVYIVHTDLGDADEQCIYCEGNTGETSSLNFAQFRGDNGDIYEFKKRGTSGDINLCATSAHAGETNRLVWVVRATNDSECWVDGTSEGTSSTGTTGAGNFDTGHIGKGERTTSDFFSGGRVHEVAIWNTTLSDNEVAQLSNSKIKRFPLQIKPANLIRYWTLDDEEDGSSADGNTFIDLTGNQTCTGDDGANNTGLTAVAEDELSYAPAVIAVQSFIASLLTTIEGAIIEGATIN